MPDSLLRGGKGTGKDLHPISKRYCRKKRIDRGKSIPAGVGVISLTPTSEISEKGKEFLPHLAEISFVVL